MDKTILKKFAIESRTDLMSKVENKIKFFCVDEKFNKQQNGEIYILSNDKHTLNLSKDDYDKRELLIKRINELGLEQVIEEAAYTWFNRIVAIRYMELNDYLPLSKNNNSLGIRVLSSKDNTPDPEIMKFTNLINPELDIDFKKEKYISIENNNEKYKYILLCVCKKLGKVIPQVFDGITDYIDILIPDNLLSETGFINKIIKELPTELFEQVEIIGWLYQFYNQEPKDSAMSSTSSKKVYSKNEVPYVTQLFTPDWVVKYLVENTLGRYAMENGINSSVLNKWKYFINDDLKYNGGILDPTKIRFIDPCSGSGHILVYAFDVLYDIYESCGYYKGDIPTNILKNNLYGLDVDDRAGQLSILSVLLKARSYDKDIFNKNIVAKMNVMSIQESNQIENIIFDEIDNKDIANYLKNNFKDSKEIGSLLHTEHYDYEDIINKMDSSNNIFSYQMREKILPLIKESIILNNKYDVVVTNPPYLSLSVMDNILKNYVNKYYADVKYDLFSIFTIVNKNLLKDNGYYGMITPPSILFLDTFEKTRKNMIEDMSIKSLIHMGRGVFGIDFGSCAYTLKKEINKDNYTKFFKLYDRTFQYISNEAINKIFLSSLSNNDYVYEFEKYENNFEEGNTGRGNKICYYKNQNIFYNLPGLTFSYWLSDNMVSIFESKNVNDFADVKQGMTTGNNNIFLRYWYEVEKSKIGLGLTQEEALNSDYKWFPYNKGGDFRKWYGNNDYVVNYQYNGKEVKEYTSHLPQGTAVRIKSYDYYFKESGTWSFISSNNFGIRYSPVGAIFDVAGSSLFSSKNLFYLIGLLSSKMANTLLKSLNPTVNFQTKNIKSVPVVIDERKEIVEELTKKNIEISKEDWDESETSWDFTVHPFIKYKTDNKVETSFNNWNNKCEERFNLLKKNEEELNKIFIDIYKLNNEMDYNVADDEITLKRADKIQDVKSFINYIIGCIFGRYSTRKYGLIYAGGELNVSDYENFNIDEDNIIPITDEPYFGDDLVSKIKEYLEIMYGNESLSDNIDFIAETLGKKGTETSEEAIRRYFLNDFYADHIKMYQKKPIYWLFDSGKKNGFKALIYMHRYNENTVPKVRLDYLHRIQTTYEKLLTDINYKLTTDLSMTDKKEAQKRQVDLNNKLTEIKAYDEKIAHIANQRINIDLDDGVTVNYAKFADILAKIK